MVGAALNASTASNTETKFCKKNKQSAELIETALRKNVFLRPVTDIKGVVTDIVNAMHFRVVPSKALVVGEGNFGKEMFVCSSGLLNLYDSSRFVKTIGPGDSFGESGFIYNSTKKITVLANTQCKLWVLDKNNYFKILEKYVLLKDEDYVVFLKTIPLFRIMNDECLLKLKSALRAECFFTNSTIIKQGDDGNDFYIITGGSVAVMVSSSDGQSKQVAKLERGDFFGEVALLEKGKRTATVTAEAPGVECIILNKDDFFRYISDLERIKNAMKERKAITAEIFQNNIEYHFVKLKDLNIKGTIGSGCFSTVQLVQYNKNPNWVFALKTLKKALIVKNGLKEYAVNEKEILLSCKSPFIVKLYNTFMDNKYLYYLMEACLGGDVCYLLFKRQYFDENMTIFISACVVEGLDYLHNRGIIYRELKPENLVFDSRGYVKLADFGYAKRLRPKDRTYTALGTSAYVAPEIILSKGYDQSVDYWSLGILIYEMLVGEPPFVDEAINLNEEGILINRNIKDINVPIHVSKAAKSIFMKLCKKNPNHRLGNLEEGINGIRFHRWFQNFSWISLQNQTLKAPYIPDIRYSTDLSNFPQCPKDKEIPPDDLSEWDF